MAVWTMTPDGRWTPGRATPSTTARETAPCAERTLWERTGPTSRRPLPVATTRPSHPHNH